MFSFTSISPQKRKVETLKFDHKPGLGLHKDIEEKEWDIIGYYHKDKVMYIMARPKWQAIEAGAYGTATNTYNRGGIWLSYKVEIIDG